MNNKEPSELEILQLFYLIRSIHKTKFEGYIQVLAIKYKAIIQYNLTLQVILNSLPEDSEYIEAGYNDQFHLFTLIQSHFLNVRWKMRHALRKMLLCCLFMLAIPSSAIGILKLLNFLYPGMVSSDLLNCLVLFCAIALFVSVVLSVAQISGYIDERREIIKAIPKLTFDTTQGNRNGFLFSSRAIYNKNSMVRGGDHKKHTANNEGFSALETQVREYFTTLQAQN